MASKQDIKLEQEYQAALKITTSSISAMQDNIQKVLNEKKRLNSETKDYLKNLQESVSSLSDSESINKKILANEREIQKYKDGTYKTTKKATNIAIQALQRQNMSLNIYAKQQASIEQVDKKAQKLKGSFDELIDKAQGFTENIPIFGSMFGKVAQRMGDSIKNKVGVAAQRFTTRYAAGLRKGMTSMQALGAAGARAGSMMLGAFMGPQAVILLIVAALGAAFFALKQLEGGMKAFRGETGLVKGQMDGIEQSATKIGMSTMHLSGSLEEGAKLAGQMVSAFGSIERLSDTTMQNAVKLSLSMGVGMENIAGTNKLFQNLNGLTEEQAQHMATSTAKMAEIYDVSPDKVLKDMSESSGEMVKYFKGTPGELQKAAVQAQKLGTSLKQSAEVAGSLLDFENSINSELEASAILGTNLNFNQARYLAANGDVLGSQQAVLKEVSKLGDLTKLNVYEQEALAKAAGMPIEDLINQQRIKRRLGKLSEEDTKALEQLRKKGVDVTKMTKEQAKQALAKQKIENKNVEATEVMTNQLKQQGLALAMQLMPLATGFMKLISGLKPLFKGFISPIMNAFKGIGDAFSTIQSAIEEAFGEGSAAGVFGSTLEVIGNILAGGITFSINLIAQGIKAVANIAGGIVKIFKGIVNMDFGMILDGLKDVGSGILRFFYKIPMALIDTLVDMFPKLGEFFSNLWTSVKENAISIFSGLGDWFSQLPERIGGFFSSIPGKIKGKLKDILPGWAKKLLGVSDASEAQGEAASLAEGGSIDDGIVQNGKVISTNPADTIMATKEPDSLFGKISAMNPFANAMDTVKGALGGAMNNLTGTNDEMMIAKLDELIAVTKESRDVYLGKEKVTDVITDTQERTGRENRFGIAGA